MFHDRHAQRAAEPDDEICGTDAYRRWLKSVQG